MFTIVHKVPPVASVSCTKLNLYIRCPTVLKRSPSPPMSLQKECPHTSWTTQVMGHSQKPGLVLHIYAAGLSHTSKRFLILSTEAEQTDEQLYQEITKVGLSLAVEMMHAVIFVYGGVPRLTVSSINYRPMSYALSMQSTTRIPLKR